MCGRWVGFAATHLCGGCGAGMAGERMKRFIEKVLRGFLYGSVTALVLAIVAGLFYLNALRICI